MYHNEGQPYTNKSRIAKSSDYHEILTPDEEYKKYFVDPKPEKLNCCSIYIGLIIQIIILLAIYSSIAENKIQAYNKSSNNKKYCGWDKLSDGESYDHWTKKAGKVWYISAYIATGCVAIGLLINILYPICQRLFCVTCKNKWYYWLIISLNMIALISACIGTTYWFAANNICSGKYSLSFLILLNTEFAAFFIVLIIWRLYIWAKGHTFGGGGGGGGGYNNNNNFDCYGCDDDYNGHDGHGGGHHNDCCHNDCCGGGHGGCCGNYDCCGGCGNNDCCGGGGIGDCGNCCDCNCECPECGDCNCECPECGDCNCECGDCGDCGDCNCDCDLGDCDADCIIM